MGHILLIDDNADFREVFKITLSHANINRTILEAEGPIQALDIFNKFKNKIQIVICDMYMPVQNGNELIEMIKNAEPSITCCLISGDDTIMHRAFPLVDKCFLKDNLQECVTFIKNIDWKRT